jgi:hypothetical protein
MSWETDILKAFEMKISPEPNSGCWLWTGNIFPFRNGYGAFTHRPSKTNMQRAHRVSWKLYRDSNITSKDHILHKCDNPLCVNPDHLFVGDQALNMEDKSYKGRQDMGEKHGMYKHGKYVGQKRNKKYHK